MNIEVKIKFNEDDLYEGTSWRGITFVGANKAEVIANVVGAVLHGLGDLENPPTNISFNVIDESL